MYYNPKLYKTTGSNKLFVCVGGWNNVIAQRFYNGALIWQPVKKLFWRFYINDGGRFWDSPEMFTPAIGD